MRFAKCNTCDDLRRQYSATYNGPTRTHLKAEFAAHLDIIKKERAVYADFQRSARNGIDDTLSMCIDGTDQLPFGIPQFAQRLKNHSINGVRLHLVIAVVHNLNTYCYMVPQCFRSDSNLTVEVLQQTLKDVELRMNGRLPGRFCLRADNCWRENKNRYVLAYLADLVQREVFREIVLDFFPVGHTHIDADQKAGCFLMAVKKRDIMSRSEFVTRLESSHAPKPTIRRITGTADWSQACRDAEACYDIHDHTIPRRFIFTKEDVNGQRVAVIRFAASALHPTTSPLPYYPFGPQAERRIDLDALVPSSKKPVPPHELKVLQDFNKSLQTNPTFLADPHALQEYTEEMEILVSPDLQPGDMWWTDGGRFASESKNNLHDALADLDGDDLKLHNFDAQPQSRGVSKATIHLVQDESIIMGRLLILKAPANDQDWKQRFWVARVQRVRHNTKRTDPQGAVDFKVRVVFYHSPSGEFGAYKEYQHDSSEVADLSDLSDEGPAPLPGGRNKRKAVKKKVPMQGDVFKSNIVLIIPKLNGNGHIPGRFKKVIQEHERLSQGWTTKWLVAGE